MTLSLNCGVSPSGLALGRQITSLVRFVMEWMSSSEIHFLYECFTDTRSKGKLWTARTQRRATKPANFVSSPWTSLRASQLSNRISNAAVFVLSRSAHLPSFSFSAFSTSGCFHISDSRRITLILSSSATTSNARVTLRACSTSRSQ
jgi:hypothetical protein